jgi:lysyl-tRNA synthetase class 2
MRLSEKEMMKQTELLMKIESIRVRNATNSGLGIGSFDDVFDQQLLYSEVLLFPQMRPEKKQVKIELEEDEIDCCFITKQQ